MVLHDSIAVTEVTVVAVGLVRVDTAGQTILQSLTVCEDVHDVLDEAVLEVEVELSVFEGVELCGS